MTVRDQVAQIKGQLHTLDDKIGAAQKTVDDLQAQKAALQGDLADLQAFIAWKQANP